MSKDDKNNELTDREHIAELIQHWPTDNFGLELTESQKNIIIKFKEDASDKFKRDSSEVVYVCDCDGANTWNYGQLAKHNHGKNYGKYAAFSEVKTIANFEGICTFCGFYAQAARASQLDDEGRLRCNRKPTFKPKNFHADLLAPGHVFGYWTVTKSWREGKGTRAVKHVQAKCVCGTIRETTQSKFSKAKSCGCKKYEHHEQLKLGALARKKANPKLT